MCPFCFCLDLENYINKGGFFFLFTNFANEFKIWWLVETNLFSKINFKVRHYEYQIKLSACEMIQRKLCYNTPPPQPLSQTAKSEQENQRPGITF